MAGLGLGLGLGLARSTGGGGSIPSTEVAPPTLSGYAVVGQTLWVDDGSDDPATTYTRQWVSGASDPPSTPISGQTAPSITVPSIAGDYIACLVTPANGQPARLSDVWRVHAATITAPVLLRTSTSGGSPFTYTVTYDNTVFADDIERVQYASDINFTTILWDASRGLTEAAFITPFLPDETADADPPWSTAPPTFTGTYYVRRKVQSLDGFVESPWSNTESNFAIVSAVTINAPASHPTYSVAGDLLTFTHTGTAHLQRVGRASESRTGRRTLDLVINSIPTNFYIGVGYDDGVKDWSAENQMEGATGWNGALAYATSGGTESYVGNGSGTFPSSANGSVQWLPADIMRIDITQGTFTGPTPNNDAVMIVSRVRAGVETAVFTMTGRASTTELNIIFMSRYGVSGTLDFTTLAAPAINGASLEFQ